MTQLRIVLAVILGVFLVPFCMLHAWTAPDYRSIKPWPAGAPGTGPYRPLVDQWAWGLLSRWYANIEDGVSGQQAWIWVDGKLVPYTSTFASWVPKWMIAVAWSVWRNNANNIKRPLRNDSF